MGQLKEKTVFMNITPRNINYYKSKGYKAANGETIEIDINDKSFCPFPYLEIETTSEEKLEEILKLIKLEDDDKIDTNDALKEAIINTKESLEVKEKEESQSIGIRDELVNNENTTNGNPVEDLGI